MKYILTYGTLRKNAAKNHNFQRFGQQIHISDHWVDGYNMHHLGGYPAACSAVGSIFCELHQVDEETWSAITRMERNAGYEVHDVPMALPTHDKRIVTASLYVIPTMPLLSLTKGRIESGDWNDVSEELARSSR